MDEHFKIELKCLLDEHEARNQAATATLVERSVVAALISAGVMKSCISKTEAYDRYGRAAVDGWVNKGYLRPIRENGGSSRYRISVVELEQVAASFNHPAVVQGKIRTRRTKTGVAYPQK